MRRILVYPLLLAIIGYGFYHFRIARNLDRIKTELHGYIERIDRYKAENGVYPAGLGDVGLKPLFAAGPFNAEIYYQRISGGYWVEFHWGAGLINYNSTSKRFEVKKGDG